MALTDTQLQNDAVALLDSLQSNGCQAGAVDPSVQTFQQSYVNSGGTLPNDSNGSSGVDGLYGANTQNALQNVINANGSNSALANMSAPAGCNAAGSGGASTTPGVYQPGVVLSTGNNYLPYIIGAIVVAGALAAYTYSKHGGFKRRRRAHA
jgi:hypothetical protein